MPLNLEALEVLDAIERRGSFAAAAIELDRVPSAITYTVRRLEEELDVLLFDRRGHRARLTPAGRLLLDEGRLLLSAADDVERRVRRVASGWETELRIAVDTLVPFARIYPMAAAFYAECQARDAAHTRLRFTREVLGGAWDALADGRADLVLGAPGDPPPGGGYRLRLMAEFTMIFAVAAQHPLAAAAEPLTEAQIAGYRAVVAADSSRHLAPRTVGLLAGQDTLTVPDMDAKLAAHVAGLGCGFLPAFVAAADVAAGRLVVKSVEPPRHPGRLHAAWREARPGRALAWWIAAVDAADWRFLALGPTSAARPQAPRSPPARRHAAR
ncbi:MAG TPA: LysR family transcriptional regulator [Casimicrobiaceae bacterium]|nr:LysR family transcriptional regulator [Casimicrobiaceae bacterium]